MANKVGRPAVPGINVTFRFPPHLFDLIHSGADIQASQRSRAHPKGHHFSQSYGLWLRSLIDFGYKNRKDIPADLVRAAMVDVTSQQEDTLKKLSMILMEEQRVKLRKYECACQALNWSLDLHRNAAVNLMVKLHATAFNETLRESSPLAHSQRES
ncbi:hypothetical protein [Pseudomonas sp. UMAB-40]|uniref:hypothetical protein n=1 Tax=Pseudomonas sp. UMAB-40 TaxID=1365407 RepID=UPI001C5810C4|nr:hypothetical protein [Pseudomonas sp. UMAB-40]